MPAKINLVTYAKLMEHKWVRQDGAENIWNRCVCQTCGATWWLVCDVLVFHPDGIDLEEPPPCKKVPSPS